MCMCVTIITDCTVAAVSVIGQQLTDDESYISGWEKRKAFTHTHTRTHAYTRVYGRVCVWMCVDTCVSVRVHPM